MQETRKKVLVMADCSPQGVKSFANGISEALNADVEIVSNAVNAFHGSKLNTLKRYWGYFMYPLSLMRKRKDYDVLIGWQQFYANNLAMWCRLLTSINRGGNCLRQFYV